VRRCGDGAPPWSGLRQPHLRIHRADIVERRGRRSRGIARSGRGPDTRAHRTGCTSFDEALYRHRRVDDRPGGSHHRDDAEHQEEPTGARTPTMSAEARRLSSESVPEVSPKSRTSHVVWGPSPARSASSRRLEPAPAKTHPRIRSETMTRATRHCEDLAAVGRSGGYAPSQLSRCCVPPLRGTRAATSRTRRRRWVRFR
jgi:hypothetical protein